MTRRTWIALVTAAAPLGAASSWGRRPYPEWDAETRDKLLTDSPWARQTTVRYEFVSPGEGMAVRAEAVLTVRWASALPVRQAMAMEWPAEGLRGESPEYVLTVSGFPQNTMPKGARWLEAELLESARLTVKGRRAMRARAGYVPPHGTHLTAELRFAKEPALTEEDGVVEFFTEAGGMRIQQKFKLKEMTYQGQLSL
jgi:hypothetical protein